jgi:hypothetical protein
MNEKQPWSPTLDKSKDFQDHQNPTLGDDPPLRIPDATEDTAPLQGSKDLSDADSLEDVIAESYEPDAEDRSKVSPKVPPRKPLPDRP